MGPSRQKSREFRIMAEIQELRAEARQGTGKGPAYRARQKGVVPAVVYGGDSAPENVSVELHALEQQYGAGHFTTRLLTLDIGGRKTRVIPRAVQVDPVTDRPVHVDFLRLGEGAKVRLAIPVHFRNHNDSPGL